MRVTPELIEDALRQVPGVLSVCATARVRRYIDINVTVAATEALFDQDYAIAKAWNNIMDADDSGWIDHELRIHVAEDAPCTGPG